MIGVRSRLPADDREWVGMRLALWPQHDAADHRRWMARWLTASDHLVLVVPREGSAGLSAFAEVGTRASAAGCESSPVAYLEGWYVDADMRRRGVGAALVAAAEEW